MKEHEHNESGESHIDEETEYDDEGHPMPKKKRSSSPKMQFSEKGKRMAAAMAEVLLMNYFFPHLHRKFKQQAAYKQLFMADMQFNLSNGKVGFSSPQLKYYSLIVSPAPGVYLCSAKPCLSTPSTRRGTKGRSLTRKALKN